MKKRKRERADQRILKRSLMLSSLQNLPLYLGLLLAILGSSGALPRIFVDIGLFLCGVTGVIWIVMKEIPQGYYSIRGNWAIAYGVMLTVFFWGVLVNDLFSGKP